METKEAHVRLSLEILEKWQGGQLTTAQAHLLLLELGLPTALIPQSR